MRQMGHQIEEAKWRRKDDLTGNQEKGVALFSIRGGNTISRNGGLGCDVTSMGASCQLDRATIAR
uniref:Uncharacterized protein n=1 Tax=Romanomermis culicivorax TaxID=13658 RepID=A0A915KYV8_ROMCU